MAFLGRLIVIFFAVLLASFAAGIAIAMGLLGLDWHYFSGDIVERVSFLVLVFFGASVTGAVGLLPMAILIAIGESFKIRSLLAHALAGAAMLVLGYYGSGLSNKRYEESIDHPPPPISRESEIAVAAGVLFGLTYWAIAGRRAGAWREPRGI